MCNKEKQMKLNLYESKCFNYRNITGEESFRPHPQQVFRQVGHHSSWWWVRNVTTKVQMSRCSMYFWKCLRWQKRFSYIPVIWSLVVWVSEAATSPLLGLGFLGLIPVHTQSTVSVQCSLPGQPMVRQSTHSGFLCARSIEIFQLYKVPEANGTYIILKRETIWAGWNTCI